MICLLLGSVVTSYDIDQIKSDVIHGEGETMNDLEEQEVASTYLTK